MTLTTRSYHSPLITWLPEILVGMTTIKACSTTTTMCFQMTSRHLVIMMAHTSTPLQLAQDPPVERRRADCERLQNVAQVQRTSMHSHFHLLRRATQSNTLGLLGKAQNHLLPAPGLLGISSRRYTATSRKSVAIVCPAFECKSNAINHL